MSKLLTITKRSLIEQLKSPVFWVILIAFPLVELLLFSKLFANTPQIQNGFVEVILLTTKSESISFSRLAISVLGQFFMISSVVSSSYFSKERESKTLMRTMTYPVKKYLIFLGHFFSIVVQMIIVISIIMISITFLFNLVWSKNILLLITVIFCCIILSSSFGFFMSMLFNNSTTAGGVMSVLVIMMSFLNGDMTSGKLIFSNSDIFTINKWIIAPIVKLHAGLGLSDIFANIAFLVFLSLTFVILSIVLFRREQKS